MRMEAERELRRAQKGSAKAAEIEHIVQHFRSMEYSETQLTSKHLQALKRASQFGYFRWPIRAMELIRGSRVLDVGCGQGTHALGCFAVGAKSYVGLDPTMKPDDDKIKNKHAPKIAGGHTAKDRFGYSPAQISEMFSNIELIRGTFEELDGDESLKDFDLIIMLNVTEHLMNLEDVFRGCADLLAPGGRLLFNHDNFYSWKGHHMSPKRPEYYDPADPEHAKYADWNHLRFDPPPGHYFLRGLNMIRLDELKEVTERYFEVIDWEEKENDFGRMTDEIAKEFSEFSRRELVVANVICLATKKSA